MNELVSIITPCYNSASTIGDTIQSVINQTYKHWELLVIDDCSQDKSIEIIKAFAAIDNRIKSLKTDAPSGSPTLPRNIGIQEAKGRFIAFLDSDDVWLPNKLSMQIPLFVNSNVGIVYSYYRKVNENGKSIGRIIKSSARHNYMSLLYGNEMGCLTVIYDTKKTGKKYFKFIGHEDYNLWLDILKEGFIAQNVKVCLAMYRIRTNSVSSNKIKIVKWIWHIYRKEQGINFFFSLYYMFFDLLKSFIKYLK
ncbi:glycosyltransferase family 2 protein [Bacteroides oleiciplenus]|uniref:Glycosyltransferase family 2 protein n=1 Tax=Bacteroides oleiciplenus TaxID=626931 RepID=A0A3E5B6J7_9BACE|nr:glycosyltransferase family 2 protein [Bacteroides oleiciplenus]RGN33240.1 glycosyltransferase family 2 protein [Bacteroides oleiciplenus]